MGQSLGSADYAGLETKKKPEKENLNDTKTPVKNNQSSGDNSPTKNDENTPQVEEAVIKIQAYVRGHLTRKALKDAQQQNATVPTNALGQSQFDEDSLIKNRKYLHVHQMRTLK